jgi:hypothetical protein
VFWIDDFIEENDMIFVVLMFALEKREKQQNKRIKINGVQPLKIAYG